MIMYLILANIFLVISYGFYYFFLRKETFFQSNRLFLLFGILLAFSLPLVDMGVAFGESSDIYHVYLPAIQIGGVSSGEPLAAVVSDSIISPSAAQNGLSWVYWGGCFVATVIFMYKLVMTIRLVKSNPSQQSFSFFGKVHVHSTNSSRDQIERHEIVHARQWHSFDVVLIEVVKIFCWFNPFAYFYERALKLQHEYIADRETAVDQPIAYAEVLMLAALGASRSLLTTSFAESRFLTYRIRMLLKAKSKRGTLARFVLILPVIFMMGLISLAFDSGTLDLPYENQESIDQFRDEVGRNVRYPHLAIEHRVVGDVMTTYEKTAGEYVNVRFIGNAHADLKASVKEVLERKSVKELAPEGKYVITVQFRLANPSNNHISPPPAPSGYRLMDPVTVVGYPSVKPDTVDNTQENVVFQSVEVSPAPPEGMSAFREWIGRNYQYPQEAIDEGLNGTVEISFVVEQDGSLTNIKVNRDPGFGTGEEAVRLLKQSPKWSPGIQNGAAVRVAYTLPIRLATQ